MIQYIIIGEQTTVTPVEFLGIGVVYDIGWNTEACQWTSIRSSTWTSVSYWNEIETYL